MKIGKVAKRTGMTVKSIRYYHDIGLVTAHRGDNGYRVYREQDIAALQFVHHCRELGFSLEDCQALLSLRNDEARTSAEVKRLASQHLQEVETKITKLNALKQELKALVDECKGDEGADCAIIKGLGSQCRK
ncbi:MAG: Cu(I)-responsive transcriptional regulator [Shewanella sp.]|nr:Cu(I)-responsive transcriptional regulator [Shewanella sp.]MCF1429953.1 Cu(I)-responsive transcriptional regulator [Shewanella sp.]MCF1437673.1 Cu(I)-responsive transcriptional regulator [Shewanella sp.]MCF1456154.1 Cu(I)-responsive transcriptional regulator [Shewanella sp.]